VYTIHSIISSPAKPVEVQLTAERVLIPAHSNIPRKWDAVLCICAKKRASYVDRERIHLSQRHRLRTAGLG
jgi:hypothetical protein